MNPVTIVLDVSQRHACIQRSSLLLRKVLRRICHDDWCGRSLADPDFKKTRGPVLSISDQVYISRGSRGDRPYFDPETTFSSSRQDYASASHSLSLNKSANLPCIGEAVYAHNRQSSILVNGRTRLQSPEARSEPTWRLRSCAQSQAPSFRDRKTAATNNRCWSVQKLQRY